MLKSSFIFLLKSTNKRSVLFYFDTEHNPIDMDTLFSIRSLSMDPSVSVLTGFHWTVFIDNMTRGTAR